jgi:hypothetical protein
MRLRRRWRRVAAVVLVAALRGAWPNRDPSTSSASPTPQGSARPWPSWPTPPAAGARSRVALARGRPENPGAPYIEQDERLWRQLQRELSQLVPGGRLVIATQSGHNIQDEQPELVLNVIGDVVQAVRKGHRGRA